MKFGFLQSAFTFSLLLGTAAAWANDGSCQVDLLKPKFNAAVIEAESTKPAQLTVSETKLRLQQNQLQTDTQANNKQQAQETVQTNDEKTQEKSTEKTSRLGGIFDILLPSQLRNPVK